MDNELDYLLSLEKSHRDALAKQLIFDCAMELEYRNSHTPDDMLSAQLMNALQALDKED